MGSTGTTKRALILGLCTIASPACGDSSEDAGGDGTGGVSGSSSVATSVSAPTDDDGGSTTGVGGSDSVTGEGGSDSGPGPIAVVNAGFEAPATQPGDFEIGAPPEGWQPVGMLPDSFRTIGVLNPATTPAYEEAVPQGTNIGLVFLQDDLPASEEAGMEQTLSETLALNSTYTLEVDVGNIASTPGGMFDFTGFPGYRVELLAGGEVIASDNNTLSPAEGRFELSVVSVAIGDTHPNAGGRLGIRLMNLDGPRGIEVNFDDVRLTRTEP